MLPQPTTKTRILPFFPALDLSFPVAMDTLLHSLIFLFYCFEIRPVNI
jgi:hypothetical protein